jgi:hypothetical protein
VSTALYPGDRYAIHLDIMGEEQRQDDKWGPMTERHLANGTARPGDDASAAIARAKNKANDLDGDNWRDILEEEVYEAFAETDPQKLRKELVQVAAVAAQWIADLDRGSA